MNIALDLRTRIHERRYPERDRVAWSAQLGEPLQAGAVLDESRSGIGIAVEEGALPRQGQTIRILTRSGTGQARRARVVRIAPGEDASAVLGCRWISGVGHHTHRPGAPRLLEGRGRTHAVRPIGRRSGRLMAKGGTR